MYLKAGDDRPPSLLRLGHLEKEAIIGGVLGAILAHGALLLIMSLATLLLGRVDRLLSALDDDQGLLEERHVVKAEFVRLGKPPDPNRLPDRQVPLKSTAPSDAVHVSKDPEARPPPPDAGPPPPNAAEDLIRRLGDRAQDFAEVAALRDREGDLEGIEGGTASEAKAGDLYAGKLYALFRRGWSVPTVISDDERKNLVTDVDIHIGPDRRIVQHRIRRESGNPLFDQSVLDRIAEVQDSNTVLPEPPPEIAEDYIDRTIGLRFRGRDAQ